MNSNTSIVTLNQSLERESKWLSGKVKLLDDARAVIQVKSDSDLETSSAVQTRISKHIKALEKHRKEITEPLDALKKQIMSQEKELRASLETELSRLKAMNDSYATRRLEEQEAAAAKAREESAHVSIDMQKTAESIFGTGVEFDPAFIPSIPDPVKPTTAAGRTVIRWDFTIIDPHQVPREYLMIDESKIRKFRDYKTQMGEIPELPGVKFTKTVSVESR